MIMEKEEEEEELFTERSAEEGEQESTEDEDEDEDEAKKTETERKSGLDISKPSVSLANRRASLPCPSDADRACLICHDDLCRRGGTIRELHCSHSFRSEELTPEPDGYYCIEDWLWMKQTCPVCHKHVVMPEPLYWTSAHVKVP